MQHLIRRLLQMGAVLVLLLGVSCPVLSQGLSESIYTYQVGDTFTVQATTRFRGRTGDYQGYTERESDRRTYTITQIDNDVVTWQVSSRFRYSDSDGGSMNETFAFTVKTDANTRAYLEGTYDSPDIGLDYYTFDYIWFHIQPALANLETRLTILGQTFVVEPPKTVRLGPLRFVDALHLALLSPTSRTINNAEYDSTGQWTLNVLDEHNYYDPATGYILRSDWQAEGITSSGQFSWSEEIVLQDSSFPVQRNWGATLPGVFSSLGWLGLPLAALVGYLPCQGWLWRRHVDKVLRFAQASPPAATALAKRALSAWSPEALAYRDLLTTDFFQEPRVGSYLELRQGLYIINDINNRLGVVDTHADKYLPNQILSTQLDNLRLLYRLALGVMPGQVASPDSFSPGGEPRDSSGLSPSAAGNSGLNLSTYGVPSRGFAVPDPYGVEVYSAHSGPGSPGSQENQETIQLLARRRVLDYTLGQAPLSPRSHLKKVERILRENPQDVLMVGDDDLVSISLARRGVQVTVLEVDPYTCALIQGIADQENLPLALWQHDLRRSLPREIDDVASRFDLFVTDSDFTIESFFLFLTRGLSLLRVGGVGLINFENRRSQRFKARYLLEKLRVAILEADQERWSYVILRNSKVETSRVRRGKYVHVNYRDDIRLAEANYSSVLFRIQRTVETQVLLRPHEDFLGADSSIYDY
ncbi:bis-aminopropyl spermidine synthase family protein [Leptolyngbya sp. PCC 6406]|uniref:bis-aminopropyl spermidine synthase family protein n=1 Tax=Leptolyngbya sp. PCC 6406 TaxID=1173264 RepID=UPI0002ABF153|nr:bis-aminopropyl spermidine synthase family protein [Leptolyngbya sp. PCC 6406]